MSYLQLRQVTLSGSRDLALAELPPVADAVEDQCDLDEEVSLYLVAHLLLSLYLLHICTYLHNKNMSCILLN